MGTGKTYSTKYLLDSNNSSGVAGQVLSTTSTGIDWVNANTVPGAGLWIASGNDIYNSNSGNVGIGTTTPGKKLDVAGSFKLGTNAYIEYGGVYPYTISTLNTAAVGNLIFNAGAGSSGYESKIELQGSNTAVADAITFTAGSSTAMVIQVNGKVGIGTTSPLASLQVGLSTSNAGSTLAMFGANLQGVLSALSLVNTGGNSAIGYGTALDFHLNSGYSPTGRIATLRETSAVVKAGMAFFTYEGGLIEKMRITNNGNVGIGTVSPTGKLTVSDNGGTGLEIYPQDSSTRVVLSAYDRIDNAYRELNYDAYNHSWEIQDSAKMVLINNGNVGIGVTGPLQKLVVQDGDGGGTGGSGIDSRTKLLINANTEAYLSFNVPALSFTGQRYMIAGTTKASVELWDYAADPQFRIASVDSRPLTFATANAEKMRISPGGSVKFNAYDSTNNTGTPTYILGTDASGNVLKVLGADIPGVPGGSGTLNTIPLWTPDGDTLGDSTIKQDSSGNIGIGTGVITTPPQDIALTLQSTTTAVRFILKNSSTGIGASDGFRIGVLGTNVEFEAKDSSDFQFYTGASQAFTIKSTGNVLVGATAINGSFGASNTILAVKGKTSGGEGVIQITGLGNNATDNVGALTFHSQAEADAMCSIRSIRGTGDDVGDMAFLTNNGGTESERMRISSGGSIGINTNDPVTEAVGLTLDGSTPFIGFTTQADFDATVSRFTRMISDGNSINFFTSNGTNGTLGAPTISLNTVVNEGVRVGIFNNNPQELLHILANNETATVEIQGGLNAITAVDQVHAEINFGANDSSVTPGIAGSIKSLSEFSNGAHAGLAFYTGQQSRTPYLQRAMQINNTGAISFGSAPDTYGTSGQVLQSNGNASPTWVAAGTPGSGIYLPLTAGSGNKLTGDLYIRKAGAALRITDINITNTDYDTLTLFASTQNVFALGVGTATGYNPIIKLNGATNNSTFTGTIDITGTNDLRIANGSLTSSQSSTTNPVARFTNTGVNDYDWVFPDSSTLKLRTNVGFDVALKLINEGSGDFNFQADTGIFLGKIGIGTTSPQDKLEIQSGYLRMYDPSANANAGFPVRWTSNNGGTNVTFAEITGITTSAGNRTGDLVFSTSNAGAPTEKMRISSAGAIKFNAYGAGTLVTDSSGNITVSSGGGAGGPFLPLAGGNMDTNSTISAFNIGSEQIINTSSIDSNTFDAGTRFGCVPGSKAAPAYTFTADLDTGMFRDGTNTLAFTAGGTQMLTINSSTLTLAGSLTVPAGDDISIGTSRINSSGDSFFLGGDVGIGTSSPNVLFHVSVNEDGSGIDKGAAKFVNTNTGQGATTMHMVQTSSSNFANAVKFWQGSTPTAVGFIRLTTSATQFITSASDLNLKKNITKWDDNTLDKFKALQPKKFRFKTQDVSEEKTLGFIAQNEVNNFPEAYPQFLGEDEKPYYGFNPSGMTTHLMKAIKDLVEKVEILENKITQLENNN